MEFFNRLFGTKPFHMRITRIIGKAYEELPRQTDTETLKRLFEGSLESLADLSLDTKPENYLEFEYRFWVECPNNPLGAWAFIYDYQYPKSYVYFIPQKAIIERVENRPTSKKLYVKRQDIIDTGKRIEHLMWDLPLKGDVQLDIPVSRAHIDPSSDKRILIADQYGKCCKEARVLMSMDVKDYEHRSEDTSHE